MGLLRNIGKTAKAVKQMIDDVNEATTAAEAARPLEILDPTPQHEIDRLLAAGGPTRGVVVRATHPPQESGERVHRMRLKIAVRARLSEGELGDEVTVKATTSWQVAALLDRGLEVPVLVDHATGRVTEVLVEDLERELAPRFGEASSRRPGWDFDPF